MGISERKEREKQERREAILMAAESIFFAQNNDKGTMDNVAEKVELSKGTLYLYFKNKTELLYAIAEKGVRILHEQFSRVPDMPLSGREQLSELGDEFVRFIEAYPRHFELILRFEIMDPLPSTYNNSVLLMEPALQILRQILIKGQQDGTIRNDLTVSEIVIILWSQLIGLMQSIHRKERYIESYQVDLKRVIKGHYRIVLKGITPVVVN